MVQIPDLPPTSVLSSTDEFIVRRGTEDKRVQESTITNKAVSAVTALTPINGGVWAVSQNFTATTEYMIFNDVAYKVKLSTSLPYTTTATPDLNFVEPVSAGNDLNSFICYADFNADPTGATDSAAAIQAAVNFAQTNQVELRGEKGTFKVLSRILIPKGNGFRWTMQRGCILDSTAATTAFFTIDAYSDRAAGVSSDFTEGLIIEGGMVKPSLIAGSYGIALFYVLNTSRLSSIEVRGGDNGILVTKMFYGFMDNIKVKDCANTGIQLLGISSDTGVNANVLSGMFVTGCKNNLVFNDDPGSFSNVLIFSGGCTFENSKETSVIIQGTRPVKFEGAYFEGNYTDGAPALAAVDLLIEDAQVTLDHGFYNVSEVTHDVTAVSVGFVGTIGRLTDFNAFKSKGVLNSFYPTDQNVDFITDAPNSDFSNAGTGYSRKRNAGTAINRAVPMIDASTISRTIAPVAGNLSGMNTVLASDPRAPVTLIELDFTTAQLRSGWTCTISAIAFESNSVNATRRGGSVEIHISAFKDGTVFKAYGDITNERALFASLYGEWFIQDDGTSKVYLGFAPLHAVTPFTQDVQYQVHDMVCRTSGDIISINTNPAAAMPDPTPPAQSNELNLKTFMYGVVTIGVTGASYVLETTYSNGNIGSVTRGAIGELRILPDISSIGSLKGLPQVNSVKSTIIVTPYIWKIRTLNSLGELLISAYDKDTGAEVDVNSFTDVQIVSFTLETIGGL